MRDSRTQPDRFVILNAPRTGSNYLCTLLNSHPDILCHHELFNPHVIGVARHLQQTEILGTVEERERDPEGFLARAWSISAGRRLIGFKLCWRQHPAALHAVLNDRLVRKIVLKRRNKVRSFVSLVLARQTGEWVVYHDSPRPGPRPKVVIDVNAMLSTIAYNRQYYEEIEASLAETRQERFELYYEELFLGDTLRLMLSFLGVSDANAAEMAGESWQLISTSLSDVVSNFDELVAALRGNEMEAELHLPSLC
jgi:LPS sulfotransferase NodH